MGWRWACWSCSVFLGIVTILMLFFLEESKYTHPFLGSQDAHSPTLSSGEDARIKATGSVPEPSLPEVMDQDDKTAQVHPTRTVEVDTSIPTRSYWARHALWTLDDSRVHHNRSYWQDIYEPFQLLATFPAVMFAALQYGWSISMLAMLAVTQSTLYALPPYNFTAAGIGNMNLPPFIGALLGSLFGGPLVDYTIIRIANRRGGLYEPETRLWLFLIPGLSMTIGCLMYGLTIAKVS